MSFNEPAISLKDLRTKALRELMPRMIEDIMDTKKENLEQYHYMIESHLANWISPSATVTDDQGNIIKDIAAAIIQEIWCLKND